MYVILILTKNLVRWHRFFDTLKTHIQQHPPNYGDGESVLTMLYECHNEQIRMDFNELYRQMNGMSLREMDKII